MEMRQINSSDEAPPRLHKALCNRWSHILVSGLPKEECEELLAKHESPANCTALAPPHINPEIVPVLSRTIKEMLVMKKEQGKELRSRNEATEGRTLERFEISTTEEEVLEVSNFCKAGSLSLYFDAWKKLTTNPTVLS
ncbi:hypothetical protein NQ317_017199 [Molorchus minor]|uniref:Uncharacterized protein n=1 Tax=Molorchus minor TaxID=1323400 RepID=A0ABQ9J344_9CUCU|nr:hypothetical protein NQ317_017199 [Molorchus minor]